MSLACFVVVGCSPDATSKKENAKQTGTAHDGDDEHGDADDGHDHSHDADEHQMGPHKGHIHKLTPGDYSLEWVHHKGNHKNDFYLLNAAGKADAPVKADSFTVTSLVGDGNESFAIDAVSPDDSGATAQYSLDNQDLSIAMNLGVKIEIKIGDKTYESQIDAHKPHDH